MIVLDASVLVAFLEPADAHHARAGRLLRRTATESWGVSTVTLAEVLVAPVRDGADAAARCRAALDSLQVRELPVAEGSAHRVAVLRVATGLKLPDCYVLATAAEHAAAVASFDERLLRAAGSLGLAVEV